MAGPAAVRSWMTLVWNASRYQGMFLPAEPEAVGQFLGGQPLSLFKRSLESRTQRLAELQTEVWIADQLAQAIIDQSAHEFLELLRSQRREIHRTENTEGQT